MGEPWRHSVGNTGGAYKFQDPDDIVPPKAFGSAFRAIADDPNGEALAVRAYLRADTSGGSDQLIILSGLEEVLAVSDVKRYREREFGISQGQQWEIRLANVLDTFNPRSTAWLTTEDSILLKWVALEIGFPIADEWETVAQGRIHRISAKTDGTVTIQAGDPIMDLLSFAWPREAVFDDRDAWVSPVSVVQKAAASSLFLSGGTGPTIVASPIGDVHNETFRLVFAAPTTYNIVYEDGTSQASGPFAINASRTIISNESSGNVVTITSNNWDQGGSAYATGDEFVLYTSKKYAAADLQPVALIQELISQAGMATGYDVIAGASRTIYDESAHWDDVDTVFDTTTCRGYRAKGSNLMDMIQGLLRAMNATIYPSASGQIAIWHLAPDGVGVTTAEISGDPDADVVSIVAAERLSDHGDLVNSTIWTYGDLNFTTGDDGAIPTIQGLEMPKDDFAATPFVDPITAAVVVRHKDVAIGWAIDSVTIDAASNRYLNRYKTDVPVFRIAGTIAKIFTNEITDAVSISEPFLAEVDRKIQVAQIACRPLENTADLVGWLDPVLAENYARVGTALVDGSDLVF